MPSSFANDVPLKESMAAKTFSAKFRSKKEVWTFLTIEVGAYLPPYENVTIYHLKDLISGSKKVKNLLDYWFDKIYYYILLLI